MSFFISAWVTPSIAPSPWKWQKWVSPKPYCNPHNYGDNGIALSRHLREEYRVRTTTITGGTSAPV